MKYTIKETLLIEASNRYKKKLNLPNEMDVAFSFNGNLDDHEFKQVCYSRQKASIYYDSNIKLLTVFAPPSNLGDLPDILKNIDVSSISGLNISVTHDHYSDNYDAVLPNDILDFILKAKNLSYLEIHGIGKKNTKLINSFFKKHLFFDFSEKLIQLSIKDSNLTEIPECIKNFKNLKHLNLKGNNIKDMHNINYNKDLKNLETLDLSRNKITDINLDLFSSSLNRVDINGNFGGKLTFTKDKPNIERLSVSSPLSKDGYTVDKETIDNLYKIFLISYVDNYLYSKVSLFLKLDMSKGFSAFILNQKNTDLHKFIKYICKNEKDCLIEDNLEKIFKQKIALGIDVGSSKQSLRELTV